MTFGAPRRLPCMTSFPDLSPAASRLAALVQGVTDEQLTAVTPCSDWPLAKLLDHVDGFALAFANAAVKGTGPLADLPPDGDPQLEPGWRDRIAADLEGLASAWKAPEAWTGMTRVGGVDLPGEPAGMFALDELVIHGWDVARASRQPYECDRPSLEAVHTLVLGVVSAGPDGPGIFGEPVAVAEDDPLLDQVIGLTGRHPAW
jgi:uncharacterized protein (TIGR03086 family)